MRAVPVDPHRVKMISTGNVTPVTRWVELSDGSRRPDPNGRQDEDEHGTPLWRVEVIMPGDEHDDRDRTGIVEVTLAAKDRPDVGTFGEPLHFDGLVMGLPYLNRRTNQLSAPRFSAAGIRRNVKPQAA